MSIMSGLFPGFSNGGAGYNIVLASGGKPTEVDLNNSEKVLCDLSVLPHVVSDDDLLKAAKTAGAVQAQSIKVKKLAKHNLQIVDGALEIAETQIQYAGDMMQREQRWQSQKARLGKRVAGYNLGLNETSANFNGFNESMSSAYNALGDI